MVAANIRRHPALAERPLIIVIAISDTKCRPDNADISGISIGLSVEFSSRITVTE